MDGIVKMKEPKNLSPRIKWLRNFYFEGVKRTWNNEYNCYSDGKPWDFLFDELTYYIVPETIPFYQTYTSSSLQSAEHINMPDEFWQLSLKERRATFIKEAIVNHVPVEIIPNDLLCGARFNMLTSHCLTKAEAKDRDHLVYGKNGSRKQEVDYYYYGFGNDGATSGHLIPDYQKIIDHGFVKVFSDLENRYQSMTPNEQNSSSGEQIKAMMIAATMPRDLAKKYAVKCEEEALKMIDPLRKAELLQMKANMEIVPWKKAENFYQAIQSLWITHMLVMADENYPGPGVSFGRLDQYLYPYYIKSKAEGMTDELVKDILGCFWFHCNTAYDAQIRVGNNGITAGFGQLFNLSGCNAQGEDLTNELTYILLDVIDDLSPILEPKPNVRIHKNTPDKLMDRVVEMIASSQGAPFLLNFDERSIAGMIREAKEAKCDDLINFANVADYASVGCLENTMVGNDRSGTVDDNLYLYKAVELALNNGKDLLPKKNDLTGQKLPIKQHGPKTGELEELNTFDKFYNAVKIQTGFIIKKSVEIYELSERIRAKYGNTIYLSTLVNGCMEKALDVTEGGAELSFVTIEGVTYATTVDSILAIKYLVYDRKEYSLNEVKNALVNNWEGYEIMQAIAKNRAPKYGRDDFEADAIAKDYMEFFANETWKYKTKSTHRQFRPGMLSWNYWASAGFVLPASPDGRKQGQFFSNAICPSNGADIFGPTANSNSVGVALGGKSENGDFLEYRNCLPNGASHTITFNSSLLRNPDHLNKFKAFLKGYIHNGGTALQINILDSNMLRDAQAHPDEYKHLLVRVTGYNAYFVTVGRELQNEIIARESHQQY
ncbi:MAG: pyruvate formate lyase family protein [Candidatus Izemoplasmatales bacterium]|jgi:formate C-acetyltransferase|nr:pyruvate formate lyase family protein [Candidatus Izemoplasmatales bacterium]